MTYEFTTGIVRGYDSATRMYICRTSDGRDLTRCRRVGDLVNNVGTRQVGEIELGTEVLLLLQQTSTGGLQAFLLGAYESIGIQGTPGTPGPRDTFLPGDQGFANLKGQRLLLRPDGSIEVRAGAWCASYYDPDDNSIHQVFQRLRQRKDKNNFRTWAFHPEADDLKDVVYHAGVTGVDAAAQPYPDIEVVAGALKDLNVSDYLHAGFDLDAGSILAFRIGRATKPMEMRVQVGDLTTGEAVKIEIERDGGVQSQIAIGEMTDDEGNTQIAQFVFNNMLTQVFDDGRYQLSNDNTEVEATNEGVVNVVCQQFNLGERENNYHLALAEIVISKLETVINLVEQAQWPTTSPGAPTAGPPLNKPLWDQLKSTLDEIKSEVHTIDK